MEKLKPDVTETIDHTTRMETLTIPTEIWDHLFKNMDLKTKVLIRQICSDWRRTITYQNHGRNYLPAVENTTQKTIQIPEGLIEEIKRGKFQNCQQIRYHNNHERSGYYLDLNMDDLLGGIEYIHQRISFVEKAVKYLWLFPRHTTTKWKHLNYHPYHLTSKSQNLLLKDEGDTGLTANGETETCDKICKTSPQKYAANSRWPSEITYYWQPHTDQTTPEIGTNQKTENQSYRTARSHTTPNKQNSTKKKIPQITLETLERAMQMLDPNSKDFNPYFPYRNPENPQQLQQLTRTRRTSTPSFPTETQKTPKNYNN